jgi:hypothetical protein
MQAETDMACNYLTYREYRRADVCKMRKAARVFHRYLCRYERQLPDSTGAGNVRAHGRSSGWGLALERLGAISPISE